METYGFISHALPAPVKLYIAFHGLVDFSNILISPSFHGDLPTSLFADSSSGSMNASLSGHESPSAYMPKCHVFGSPELDDVFSVASGSASLSAASCWAFHTPKSAEP